MENVFDTLVERGLIAQTTDSEKVRELLGSEKIKFYIGFDPTADSLHIGHFVSVMVMAHMQRAGHTPIALFGGGTGMIGDPSGKTDMRKMLTKETITHNIECFRQQMSKLVDFSDGKAIMVNNADWLWGLNYIDFIREIGVHFSVNRMLAAECYKQRLERGLSFIEFNYQLLQSFDYLNLHKKYNACLQIGGDDQWGNIVAGIDLIRRLTGDESYGLTFPLVTRADGQKMGKSEKGAIFLDANLTPVYDFFQYWRNVPDADVRKFFLLFTFLEIPEIDEIINCNSEKITIVLQNWFFAFSISIHFIDFAKTTSAFFH